MALPQNTEQDVSQAITRSNSNSSTATKDNVNNTYLNLMHQRLSGSNTSQTKYDYTKLLEFINRYGNDIDGIDKDDRRILASELGLSNKEAKRLAADLNGKGNGLALHRFKNNANIRGYIDKDGKWVEENFKDDAGKNAFDAAYEAAKFHGTNYNEVATRFNKAVDDWHKEDLFYDPKTQKYYIRNFWDANGVNNRDGNRVDVTNSDWLKNDPERQKAAILNAYGQQIDRTQPTDITFDQNFLTTVGYTDKTYDALNELSKKINAGSATDTERQNWESIKSDISSKIIEHYNKLAAGQYGQFDWEKSIAADVWYKNLIDSLKSVEQKPAWLREPVFQSQSYYRRYLDQKNGVSANGSTSGNYQSTGQFKQGGALKARVLAKGGYINKLRIGGNSWWRTVLDYVPIAGTAMLAADKLIDGDKNVDWKDIAISGALDAATFIPGLGIVRGLGKIGKGLIKVGGKAGSKLIGRNASNYLRNSWNSIAKKLPRGNSLESLQKQKKIIENWANTEKDKIRGISNARKLKSEIDNVAKSELDKITTQINKIQNKELSRSLNSALGKRSTTSRVFRGAQRTAAWGAGTGYRNYVASKGMQPQNSENLSTEAVPQMTPYNPENDYYVENTPTNTEDFYTAGDRNYSNQVSAVGYNKYGSKLKYFK